MMLLHHTFTMSAATDTALVLKTLSHPARYLILSPQECLMGAGHVGEEQKILIEGHGHL